MSNHEADAFADQELRTSGGARRLRVRAVVVGSVLFLGLGGLAGCGDDDDASDTVPGGTAADSAASSAPADEPTTTARPTSTSAAPSSTTSAPSTSAAPTTAAAAAAAVSSVPAEASAPADSAAATGADTMSSAPADATQPVAAETSVAGTAAGAGTESSAPVGSEPAGTVTGSSGPTTSAGPTTTGPECTFTDNEEFPLVRCDAGPPIAALQSVLQVLEYEIGTVDCLFGDQTHYAVRAFQTDQELTVSGEVDEATWAVLEESFLADWGTDTNGNGTIEPNEITLTCA